MFSVLELERRDNSRTPALKVLQYPDGPIKRGTKEHFSVMKTVRHTGEKSHKGDYFKEMTQQNKGYFPC